MAVRYHRGQFPPDRLLDWSRLIPLLGPTAAAVARYDGMLAAIPNPEILLAPLTTQEAVLSSRIEGTQATIGEVLEFEAGRIRILPNAARTFVKYSTIARPCSGQGPHWRRCRYPSESSAKRIPCCLQGRGVEAWLPATTGVFPTGLAPPDAPWKTPDLFRSRRMDFRMR